MLTKSMSGERFAGSAPVAALDGLVTKAEAVVEEEMATLAADAAPDLSSYTFRKSQLLLDLGRALRQCEDADLPTELVERVAALRDRLSENLQLLDLHLGAVRRLSELMTEAVRREESDGTYSVPRIR